MVRRSSHSDVLKIFRLGRLLIKIIASVLALLFTWLQFRDVSLPTFLEAAKPELIQKIALVIYYFCWLFGSTADTDAQESVYVDVPKGWRVGIKQFLLVVVFFAVTAAMLWVSGDEKKFAFLLTVFILYNVFGWWYLNHILKSIMGKSETLLKTDRSFVDLEKLKIVRHYLTGRWQWKRFGAMCLMILVLDIICFAPLARGYLTSLITATIDGLKYETMYRLLPDLYLLFFVLVAESWIWIMRVRVATSLTILDDLKLKYDLRPRA